VGAPRVTVVTSFLNAERFIQEAVDSVFAQSYKDWELLLVDDGSTDGSTQAARRYARDYPQKVKYFEHAGHENRGASASRNLGIREARASYIAILDADDLWLPAKLEQQVALLDAHPEAAMVYGHTQYWYSWTGDPDDVRRDLFIHAGVEPNTLVRPPALLVRLLRQEIPVPCPSDIIMRRDNAIDVGGFEETFRRIFTDQVFYSKFCLRWPVFVAGQSWFKYRRHPDSAVAVVKATGQLRSARLNYLNWFAGYLDTQHIQDRDVRRALRSARWKCAHPRLFSLASDISASAERTAASLPAPVRRALRALIRKTRNQRTGRPR
jgi:glycosyltransferase involved in cell wall biosynthesis